jgi:hypothetical protein
MIVDVLPNQYEALASKHSFRPWQTGLLGNMLSDRRLGQCVSVNMGSDAGHTYFTRIAASSDFPSRTKVYLTRQEAFAEYSNLLFDESKSHEPIELLDECKGYSGGPVEFILVDMGGEASRRFKKELGRIASSIPASTRIVILQADFSLFS